MTGTAQFEAWQQRLLPPVEQVRSDVWSIPLPLPGLGLRYVTVYAVTSDSGLLLVDAGWGDEAAWRALGAGLASFGATWHDIEGVLLTHQHFDHIGLARRLQEEAGAWVALHSADRDEIMHPTARDPELSMAADIAWLLALGADRQEAIRLGGRPGRAQMKASLVVPDRVIEDGDRLIVGTRRLRALHTPGHTPGHVCFLDDASGLLFAGDHVLPRITPNISAQRDLSSDALGDFLGSLDRVASRAVTEVLPAHEWRFVGVDERLEQLRIHHRRRLGELLEVLAARPGETPWRLAGHLSWSRPWETYDGFMKVTAVEETMAHLVHLCRLDLVNASAEPVRRFSLSFDEGQRSHSC